MDENERIEERLRRIASTDDDSDWNDVVRRAGPGFSPRRGRRFGRVLRARPRLLAGASLGATAVGVSAALALSAATTAPAFAVTPHHDGTYTVWLRSRAGIAGANRRLSQLGVRARLWQAPVTCNVGVTASTARRSVRIDARSIPHGKVELIETTTNGDRANFVTAKGTEGSPGGGCVPPCPTGHGATELSPAPPPGGNSGNSGNSGNTGNSGNSGNSGSSGNSGNTGDAGNSGSPGPGWVTVPAHSWTVICSGPPPAAGNSGNSGNSGNTGASGNS
jgi:hypothetical protein